SSSFGRSPCRQPSRTASAASSSRSPAAYGSSAEARKKSSSAARSAARRSRAWPEPADRSGIIPPPGRAAPQPLEHAVLPALYLPRLLRSGQLGPSEDFGERLGATLSVGHEQHALPVARIQVPAQLGHMAGLLRPEHELGRVVRA